MSKCDNMTKMSTTVLDTLAYAKRLKAAGVPDAQAEAQAEALTEALTNQLATKQDITEFQLTTKQDISELRIEMRHELSATRAEAKQDLSALRIEMRELKIDLIKWMVGIALVPGAMIVGILVKLS